MTKFVPDPDTLRHADALEKHLGLIASGRGKVGKIPLESIMRLIAYARTGSIANPTLNFNEAETPAKG